MPEEHKNIAKETHAAINRAIQTITTYSVRSYTIYTAIHENKRTDLEYRTTPLPRQRAYKIEETTATTMRGDGTVTEESAMGYDPPFKGTPVTNVSHDVMCNSEAVVNCLSNIFAGESR